MSAIYLYIIAVKWMASESEDDDDDDLQLQENGHPKHQRTARPVGIANDPTVRLWSQGYGANASLECTRVPPRTCALYMHVTCIPQATVPERIDPYTKEIRSTRTSPQNVISFSFHSKRCTHL